MTRNLYPGPTVAHPVHIQDDEGQQQGQPRIARGPMGQDLSEPLDEAPPTEGDE